MATTMQPATGETTKQLVNYRADGGVAVIEMSDPPANTYSYEMNRQLDDAILRARMDNDVYVIVMTGAGDKFFSAGAKRTNYLKVKDPVAHECASGQRRGSCGRLARRKKLGTDRDVLAQ